MPASRSAAATTLAPRSCPSSPGLATSTRIGRCFLEAGLTRGEPWLEEHGLAVRAPHALQRVTDLVQRAVGAGAIEHRADNVLVFLGRPLQGFEALGHQFGVAPRPHVGHAADL